jgi:hypothetical protein
MTAQAPRIGRKLLEAIVDNDDGFARYAEINRAVGARASELGVIKPSYEQVRYLVHELRRRRARPRTRDVLLDVVLRVRPVDALTDHLSGVGVNPRP